MVRCEEVSDFFLKGGFEEERAVKFPCSRASRADRGCSVRCFDICMIGPWAIVIDWGREMVECLWRSEEIIYPCASAVVISKCPVREWARE